MRVYTPLKVDGPRRHDRTGVPLTLESTRLPEERAVSHSQRNSRNEAAP